MPFLLVLFTLEIRDVTCADVTIYIGCTMRLSDLNIDMLESMCQDNTKSSLRPLLLTLEMFIELYIEQSFGVFIDFSYTKVMYCF